MALPGVAGRFPQTGRARRAPRDVRLNERPLSLPFRLSGLGRLFVAVWVGIGVATVFAFHYASAYYRPQPSSDDHVRGLRFPGGTEPDYLDFPYYACVIGMTSQVADVALSARHMRRLTLVHGVASFAFNLVILALGVNLIGSAIE